MPIYKGSTKIGKIYRGSTKIGKVYKGSTLVYQSKNPMFYATGQFDTSTYTTQDYAYSSNGTSWTKGTLPFKASWGFYKCFASGNGKIVIIPFLSASNSFAYSTDGINWTKGTLPTTALWNAITFGNGKFVAVVDNSNIFAYSTNGINWTQGTLSTYLSSIAYAE